MNALLLDPTATDFDDELNAPDSERALYSAYPREGLAYEEDSGLASWADDVDAALP